MEAGSLKSQEPGEHLALYPIRLHLLPSSSLVPGWVDRHETPWP